MDGLDQDQSGKKFKKEKWVQEKFAGMGRWGSSPTWNVCTGPLLETLQLCSHEVLFMRLKPKDIKSQLLSEWKQPDGGHIFNTCQKREK